MSFLDPLFFFFIVPALLAIALARGRARIVYLIAASYVFFAASYPPYLLILIGGTLFDYWAGNRIHAAQTDVARKLWMAGTLTTNLGVLAGFKYLGFFVANIDALFHAAIPTPHVTLPLGISFFTFQSLSYTIDIYRRVIKPAPSLLDFASFISFFPHLVAGPIIRARDYLPQLASFSPLNPADTSIGMGLVLSGYFKKAVVGDNAGALVDPVFADPISYGGAAHWLAAMLFAIQIYADFSGYTDIAIGLSRMLGIRLRENFHWPYLSQSIRDFWRRWHISLSFFLRDYLYFSLGGDRGGTLHTARNVIVVWFLGGLWHGAAWTFVAWGLYHGLLVSLGRLLYPTALGAVWRALTAPGRVTVSFLLVTLGWVLFRAQSLSDALEMWGHMLAPWQSNWLMGVEPYLGPPMAFASLATVAHALNYAAFRKEPGRTPLLLLPEWALPIAIAAAGVTLVVLAGETRRFIYFDF
jgi:alginate O-acetyltransferase complex protein AlgI